MTSRPGMQNVTKNICTSMMRRNTPTIESNQLGQFATCHISIFKRCDADLMSYEIH